MGEVTGGHGDDGFANRRTGGDGGSTGECHEKTIEAMQAAKLQISKNQALPTGKFGTAMSVLGPAKGLFVYMTKKRIACDRAGRGLGLDFRLCFTPREAPAGHARAA